MAALLALLALLLALLAGLPAAAVERTRGATLTEQRLALVIGNAAYPIDPLDNPVNDARLIAGSLRKAGFEVNLHENLGRNALLEALRDFGNRLNEHTVAVVYYAGHGLQLRDRNYLIPVDAEIRSEDEIPISGLDLDFVLRRMSHARSRINIVILDACRNNPFAGKTVPAAPGLAQMDAPVGTLLAFATAPGKVAADGIGGNNSLYATHIARHVLTPGLPVELMFKRVREGVVRDSEQQQVPWESSSLQGEFAFVPGMAAPASPSPPGAEAATELAFWNSIQSSQRADEYRAYLRQYPNGRFAALAQTRIAAFAPPQAPSATAAPAPAPQTAPPQVAAVPPVSPSPGPGGRPELLPRPGDSWRYLVRDQFRLGDLYVTAKVDGVTAEGVVETWTTTSDAQVRTTVARLEPGFHALPGWTLTPPEFAPYLLSSGLLQPGQRLGEQRRQLDDVSIPLRVSIEGEEELSVAAGRFRTVKLVLRGQAPARSAGRGAPVIAEYIVWYAPEVKRPVKYSVSTRVGNSLKEATTFELTEFRLN